jgi:hypothetical protein
VLSIPGKVDYTLPLKATNMFQINARTRIFDTPHVVCLQSPSEVKQLVFGRAKSRTVCAGLYFCPPAHFTAVRTAPFCRDVVGEEIYVFLSSFNTAQAYI